MMFTAPPAFVFVDGHAPILFSHCADLNEVGAWVANIKRAGKPSRDSDRLYLSTQAARRPQSASWRDAHIKL